jgi:geranylgeranyl diphosphate synthase, type I
MKYMSFEAIAATMLPELEAELQRQVSPLDVPGTRPLFDMLAYHMGWNRDGSSTPSGKRVRPLILLLVSEACGGRWLRALPAAAAVELVHNFSLLHDDIEDNSPTRHGRPTVWNLRGVPMAINAGDALFAISNQSILDAISDHSPATVVRAAMCLHSACLALTAGQFLDMSYEKRLDLTVDDYWPMVEGKTAALISAAAEIGAILAGVDDEAIRLYGIFGRKLGLAFQVLDDILGIWGDESKTGKSAAGDLVDGKRSLPVLFGLGNRAEFARRWAASPIQANETSAVAELLRAEGAYTYSLEQAEILTGAALEALRSAHPLADGDALMELAQKLLTRPS